MQKERIPFSDTRSFSSLFLKYQERSSMLNKFVSVFPAIDQFDTLTKEISKQKINREVLVEALTEQYISTHTITDKIKSTIDLLASENTYTVTTGHQLQLAGGPLFFTYKILSAIKLAEELNTQSAHKYIPVFWMATEDHDVNEIDHITFGGKVISWEHTHNGTPITGSLDNEGLSRFIEEIIQLSKGKAYSDEVEKLLRESYLKGEPNLAVATRRFVHALFRDFDLLVIDANDARLKAQFVPVLKKEVVSSFSKRLVDKASEEMNDLGFSSQVYPRDCNLFYLNGNNRERIEKQNRLFETVNQSKKWDADTILEEIDMHPGRFSPNVILRPLYQQCILPNIATIGGPAEVAYWMQLKEVFNEAGVFFPVLVPRNCAMIISERQKEKFFKTGFNLTDLFKPLKELEKEYVKSHGGDLSLSASAEELKNIYEAVIRKATEIDVTLGPSAEAELKRALKGLDRVALKMMRATKRKHAHVLSVVSSLKESLTPGEGLQEREETILPFLLEYGSGFIDELYQQMDAVPSQFLVLTVK